MRTVLLKTITAALTAGLIFTSTSIQAEELNFPGFSGSVNTTLNSGFTVRVSERDCELQDGYKQTIAVSDLSNTAFVALGGASAAQVEGKRLSLQMNYIKKESASQHKIRHGLSSFIKKIFK